MAAETLTATQAAAAVNARRSGGSGVVHCAYGTYEIAANVEDGDIFEMVKIPAGARVVAGFIYGDDIDTNASETLDMDFGWADNGGSGTHDSADPDGFGNLGVWVGDPFANGSVSATTGNIFPLSGVMADGDCPKFTKETTLQLEANAVAATFTAGAVSVAIFYIVEAQVS